MTVRVSRELRVAASKTRVGILCAQRFLLRRSSKVGYQGPLASSPPRDARLAPLAAGEGEPCGRFNRSAAFSPALGPAVRALVIPR